MMSRQEVDIALVRWGDRLFYPGNRIVKPDQPPRLRDGTGPRAAAIRHRIAGTVVRQSPQAFMKIRGGGRGMRAIAGHFAYISRNGQLDLEDDRGVKLSGKDGLRDVVDQWRYAGSMIPDVSCRREAFAIVLSAPAGSDPQSVLRAAREFARTEIGSHRFVLVLHEDTANPHVHLTVRARSMMGQRLDPWPVRDSWRTAFAEKLRAVGIDVEATWQSARGENRNYNVLWQSKAKGDGSLNKPKAAKKTGKGYLKSRAEAMESWAYIMKALAESEVREDRQLAERIAGFVRRSPFVQELMGPQVQKIRTAPEVRHEPTFEIGRGRSRPGPEITR